MVSEKLIKEYEQNIKVAKAKLAELEFEKKQIIDVYNAEKDQKELAILEKFIKQSEDKYKNLYKSILAMNAELKKLLSQSE